MGGLPHSCCFQKTPCTNTQASAGWQGNCDFPSQITFQQNIKTAFMENVIKLLKTREVPARRQRSQAGGRGRPRSDRGPAGQKNK